MVIVGNNCAPLEAVAEEIMNTKAAASMTHDVRVIAMDLARAGAAQELFDRVEAEGIAVDVVINNAGIFSFCDILATPDRKSVV